MVLDNEKFRLDSEFFRKEYLDSYSKIKSSKSVKLKECIEVLTDFHANGSYENIADNFKLLDNENYAYMIRSTDLEANNFEDNVKYIDKHAYDYLSKTKLSGGELLINKIGSPGVSYLMPKLDKKSSLGMNLFMLKMKEDSNVSEIVAWLFLNTKLGKNIIMRKVNGTVPLTIDKVAIRSIYLPIFGNYFKNYLELMVAESQRHTIESKKVYCQSENLLLDELGMLNYQPSEQGINVKSLKNSFLTTGRLDAEYYQPKFDILIDKIKKSSFNCLKDLVTISKSIEPGSDAYQETGIPFYRVSNLTKFGLTDPDIHLDENKYNDIIRPKKDTILLTKDGTVGMAYKVTEDINGITSGAILHLKVKDTSKILPDYLTLVLNSLVVQLQAERDAGGSIIQHWKPSEIGEVIIPILDFDIQKEIADLVQQSFTLKSQSEKLLEDAKKLVEMAIEEGEDKALRSYELGLMK